MIACSLSYDDSFTDEEIEATFRQVKALGVATISSPMSMATARRIVPFAERHGVTVAIHNQADGNQAGAIATPAVIRGARALAAFRLKLDVGNRHRVQRRSGGRACARHQSRVAHVLVRGSPAERRQQPATSAKATRRFRRLVKRLKTSQLQIPALVEYDYIGLHPSVDEVTASLRYVTKAIE